jgi:hypothetical protein
MPKKRGQSKMEITHDSVVKWMDAYFEAFNKNAGPLKTVANMQKYFTPDLEFWAYNQPGDRPASLNSLLRSMVHPGLHEQLTPREYVVDLKQMIVVVQFQVQFSDQPSGKVWPPKQTSTHYFLTLDEKKELKIKKIAYFMEYRSPEESSYKELWSKYRDQALAEQKK